MELDTPVVDSFAPLERQYLVVQSGNRRLAFSNTWVAGLLLVERSQVLELPFYHPAILGIVPHQGKLLPLVELQHLLEGQPGQLREVFNAIQLHERHGLAGVGLAFDQILGNFNEEQIIADSTIEPFQTHLLGDHLYQLQRWRKLTA
jgi:hypothetical protein